MYLQCHDIHVHFRLLLKIQGIFLKVIMSQEGWSVTHTQLSPQTGFFMVFATKCHQLVPGDVAVVMKLEGNANLVCQDKTCGATILNAQRCHIKGSPHQPATPRLPCTSG